MKRITGVLCAVVLTLAACGSSSDAPDTEAAVAETVASAETTPAETEAPLETEAAVAESSAATGEGDAAASATFNDTDVRFAQGGLGHHAQAVELAEIALDPKAAARPEVLEIGRAITAPSPEFEAIEGLLTTWGKPLELSKEEMAKMEGMATPETVDLLAAKTGGEFDTLFLSTLVTHHEGAIKMAEKAIQEGANPQLREIATKLLEMRTSELTGIKALLAGG